MSKTQKQTQIHAHECSLSPPLFLFVVVSLFFVLLFGFCPFCLCTYVTCSSMYCCCFRLLTMSMSSVYFHVVWWLCLMLCCVCGSVLVKRVCVCMYVSVGCVCERSQVCWCTTHALNTRHTHLTHHTHPHGRKGCVMCCIVQCCGKQHQTHNTTTHHNTA